MNRVLFLFNWCLWGILLVSLLPPFRLWQHWGTLVGDGALISLTLTLLPGILRRLNLVAVCKPLFQPLSRCRRQMGIATFQLALLHTLWSFLMPRWPVPGGLIPVTISDWMGVVAMGAMGPLYLTSNAFSVRFLGARWRLLHVTIHGIVWFVALHILIKEVSLVSVVFFGVVVADAASFAYLLRQDVTSVRN